MPESTPPLTPATMAGLLARIEREWHERKKIFDLPTARIWRPDPEVSLAFEFLGRPCATPIGPAAGPHSQLAQNLALAWLGGSRLFELKTVQILDELEIARPCIDMETIGYNIEWSQELRIPQSLEEYVKASMLIDLLAAWPELRELTGPDPGDHVFDMSVGYDLAGISSPPVASFIEEMKDASRVVERLRGEVAGSGTCFADYADIDFRTRISDTLTLSTFHGCPPDEIDAITRYLLERHELDVIVKLNPTLLGYERVAQIVNDDLGYDDVVVKESAFAEDLQFDRGIQLIGELAAHARGLGRRFGIKLTNTLVVENRRGFMPEDTMYLSGAPLHVLASTLLAELAGALPGVLAIPGHDGEVMVSFSAGVTKGNLAAIVGAGVEPATVCSDLLKPGGYGRLAPMLKSLTGAVREAGATDLDGFRASAQRAAVEAGHDSTAAAYVAQLQAEDQSAYHREAWSKLPRAVDNELQMFGCVACNFCVTVCPNDAFTSITSLEGMADRQQYLVFSELCNDCGNCMVFCPERGDPAEVKPRLYRNADLFHGRSDRGQGFLLDDAGNIVEARGSAEAIDLVQRLIDQSPFS